jgi:hypothetical protein
MKIFNEIKHLKLKFGECFNGYTATAYGLDQWSSNLGKSNPGYARRHILGHAKSYYGICKLKKSFVLIAEQSGPDLGLVTGDPDVRTLGVQR